jgi:hypothetical protein
MSALRIDFNFGRLKRKYSLFVSTPLAWSVPRKSSGMHWDSMCKRKIVERETSEKYEP